MRTVFITFYVAAMLIIYGAYKVVFELHRSKWWFLAAIILIGCLSPESKRTIKTKKHDKQS